jgi:hypothetical protein
LSIDFTGRHVFVFGGAKGNNFGIAENLRQTWRQGFGRESKARKRRQRRRDASRSRLGCIRDGGGRAAASSAMSGYQSSVYCFFVPMAF